MLEALRSQPGYVEEMVREGHNHFGISLDHARADSPLGTPGTGVDGGIGQILPWARDARQVESYSCRLAESADPALWSNSTINSRGVNRTMATITSSVNARSSTINPGIRSMGLIQ